MVATGTALILIFLTLFGFFLTKKAKEDEATDGMVFSLLVQLFTMFLAIAYSQSQISTATAVVFLGINMMMFLANLIGIFKSAFEKGP